MDSRQLDQHNCRPTVAGDEGKNTMPTHPLMDSTLNFDSQNDELSAQSGVCILPPHFHSGARGCTTADRPARPRQNGAREAARYMAVHYAESGASDAAIAQGLAAAPSASGATITITSECAPTMPSHDPLAVTATATLVAPGITGWFAPVFGSGLTLTAESRMICGG